MPKRKNVIPLTICDSSLIAAHGYDGAEQLLEVQFKNGQTYQYQGVPGKLYGQFKSAESVGKFFGAHIRGKFPHAKLEADAPAEKTEESS